MRDMKLVAMNIREQLVKWLSAVEEFICSEAEALYLNFFSFMLTSRMIIMFFF